MISNKLKIVWICHFTNAEVQDLIPLWKNSNEFATWIPNTIKGFENLIKIELYVICPHRYIKKMTQVTLRNIKYYFIPIGIPIIHRHWPNFLKLDIYTKFYFFRLKVKKIILSINPDLITLFGAENAYYSSSILDFKNRYPVLVVIQGFISQFKQDKFEQDPKLTLAEKIRLEVEERILKTFRYFCGEQDSSAVISTYNLDHIFFKLYFPINETLASQINVREKKYDCIYFGKLTRIKGSGDFVKVISEIKRSKQDIKACIIGGGDETHLRSLSRELGCENNIEFTGFLKSQKEVFEFVKASRVFLAPPHQERLSSTIREAMFLKVPIVAYATGGIPYINEYEENILLVKTGDYKAMAKKTLMLLQDKDQQKHLVDKAYKYCINEYSVQINTQRILSAFQSTINEYHKT